MLLRAAADAVIARNGYEFGGARLRVEHAHRGEQRAAFGGGGYGGGYGAPMYGGGYGGGMPPRGGCDGFGSGSESGSESGIEYCGYGFVEVAAFS